MAELADAVDSKSTSARSGGSSPSTDTKIGYHMAKSPVYGRGRNRKHRPQKSPLHPSAGGINMKGKKSKPDHCWCCVCIDMRDELLKVQHQKEMENLND